MNREQVFQMALEAGFTPAKDEFLFLEILERFGILVAANEREECAISCEVNAARWIDDRWYQWGAAHECAAAIRARK